MKVTIKRASNATSSKTGNQFQICVAANENNEPIRFFASSDEYKVGDKVELYVDYGYDFTARVAHKRIV